MDFEDLIPKKGESKKNVFGFDDLIPDQKPSLPVDDPDTFASDDEIPPSLGSYSIGLPFKQSVSPDEGQFVDYLKTQGFEDLGERGQQRLVRGPDGKPYDVRSRDDALIRNFPDIAITALTAASGVGLGAKAGQGAIKYLMKVLGVSALEGGMQAAGETARQGVGIGLGYGKELNTDKIENAAIAGASAPVITSGVATLGRGLKSAQEKIAGVPKALADKIRANPSYLKSLSEDSIERAAALQEKAIAEEIAIIQDLQDNFMKDLMQRNETYGRAGAAMDESISKSTAMASSDDLLRHLKEVEANTAQPIGVGSPLNSMKKDLESNWASQQKELPFVDLKGRPYMTTIPEEPIDAETLVATRRYLDDLSSFNPNDPSTYRSTVAKKAGGKVRGMEAAISPIDAAFERQRLNKLLELKQQFPSLRKGLEASDEQALSDFLFKPRLERPVEESLGVFDDLASDYGFDPMKDRFSAIKGRMTALEEFQDEGKLALKGLKKDASYNTLSSKNPMARLLTLGAGATGFAGGPMVGIPSALTSAVTQAPATTLQINKLLGYLDRLGAKGGGKVGKGAATLREAALIEMMEE